MKYYFRYKFLQPDTGKTPTDFLEIRTNNLRGTCRIKKKSLKGKVSRGFRTWKDLQASPSTRSALTALAVLFVAILIALFRDFMHFYHGN